MMLLIMLLLRLVTLVAVTDDGVDADDAGDDDDNDNGDADADGDDGASESDDDDEKEEDVPSLHISNPRERSVGKAFQASSMLEWDDFAPKLGVARIVTRGENEEDDDDSDSEIGGTAKKARHKASEKRKAEERIRAREVRLFSPQELLFRLTPVCHSWIPIFRRLFRVMI